MPHLIAVIGDYVAQSNQNRHIFVWTASVAVIPTKIVKWKEAVDAPQQERSAFDRVGHRAVALPAASRMARKTGIDTHQQILAGDRAHPPRPGTCERAMKHLLGYEIALSIPLTHVSFVKCGSATKY